MPMIPAVFTDVAVAVLGVFGPIIGAITVGLVARDALAAASQLPLPAGSSRERALLSFVAILCADDCHGAAIDHGECSVGAKDSGACVSGRTGAKARRRAYRL